MTDTDDALRARLDRAFDALCETPASGFIDVDEVFAVLDALSDPARAAELNARYVIPSRGRWLARAAASTVTLSAWLPEDTAQKIAEHLGRPVHLPRRSVEQAVGNEKVREAVRATISDALTTFVQRAGTALGGSEKGGGVPGGGMLRGALSFGAKAASKALGGIGEEIQQQLMERARDSLDGIVANAQSRIVERVLSDDTAKTIGKRRRAFFERSLKRTEAEATRGAHKAPWADIDAMNPAVFAHNAARPELREAVRDELEAIAKDLEGETLGSILDRVGAREVTRRWFRRVGAPAVKALLEEG